MPKTFSADRRECMKSFQSPNLRGRDAVRDPARLAALRGLHLLDNPPELPFDRLTRLAAKVVGAPVALVSLVEADRQFFLSSLGLSEPWSVCRQTPLSHSFCQHVVRSGEPLVITDARTDPRILGNLAITDLGVVAYLGIPLVTATGHVLGSFCVIDSRPRDWSRDEENILQDLAASVMTEIELRAEVAVRQRTESALRSSRRRLAASLSVAKTLNVELERQKEALAEANARLAELASTDALTGLKNRRHFDEALRDGYALMGRRKEPVSVILADVDEFKLYNDTYGHPAGDEVLRRVGAVFRKQIRSHETVARFGGEEFAVILLGDDVKEAAFVAERLREALEAEPWPTRRVTASFGVAASIPGIGPDVLVRQADEALYISKRDGRNRVTRHAGLSSAARSIAASHA